MSLQPWRSISSGRRTALAVVLLLSPGSAFAREEDPRDREVSAEAAPRPADMPLSSLPEVPSTKLPTPRPEAIEAIDGILSRIVSDDPVIRERASREIFEARPDWVAGLALRMDRLAEQADRKGMKKTLEELRRKARKQLDKSEATPDYLDVLLEFPAPDQEAWKQLTQVLCLSRMLATIDGPAAVRELIRIYVRFGDFMRIDTQRQLEEMGDRAVAGLIEARRHQAPKIARWAEKQLDLRGKAIAHEAVRTDDQEALAEILVALGRTRDPDSGRILISFAGTEQTQIRTAARQGIVLMGEVAAWQLRDAFLDTTGRKPPRDWTWKRTARELFTEYDRLRLEHVIEAFDAGREAEKAGKLDEMKAHYDLVLSYNPLFERRAQMAPGYLHFAQEQQEAEPEGLAARDAAIDALRRAERVSDDKALQSKARSLRLSLDAARLRERGLVDRALLSEAAALDPENAQASSTLKSPTGEPARLSSFARHALAWTVSGLAMIGAAWILWTARRRKDETPQSAAGATPAPSSSAADQNQSS